jgi:clathrin heavy chain
VHPEGKLLVLYAANAVQIYDVETKEKQQDTMLPEPAVFLKWIDDKTLGVVTGRAVFHWTLGEAAPVKKFDRHPTLAQSQIINYKASADGKWCLLNGIAGGADGITGQLQLYSVERNVSQPVPAHAGTFATIEADQADLFAFADKAGAGGSVRVCAACLHALSRAQLPAFIVGSPVVLSAQIKVSKIGGAGDAMAPVQAAYQYPQQAAAAAATDFPVAMTASTKYDVLFMLTKMGFIFVVDTKTGATIFSNQVSAQPVFIAAAHECTGGIAFVNQGGQVLSVTLDEDNVIEYIATRLRNIEVAARLSARNNLPGAVIDQMLQQQFEALFQQNNFAGCAELACQAEKLRTKATIQRLQNAPTAPGAPPAVMVYFQTLLNKGKLNSVETIALIGVLLPMGQMAFIEQKLGEDKLACTEEVGDLFKTQINNPKLAMQVYLKGKCHGKVIMGLLETGQAAKVGPYLDQAGATDVDWTGILQSSVTTNPGSALELATMLLGKGENLDKGAVADMFVKASAIQQATGFMIQALQGESKEEDAALQTKALEIPLTNGFPQVADDIMNKGVFLHFDKVHIAKLCEKHNVPSRALQLYTEPEDIKRVIVQTQQLQPEFLVNFFGTLDAAMQMECMEELLTNNLKANMRLVATVAAKYSDSVGAAELTEMFKKHKADEGLFLYLSTLVNSTLDPEIHFGYIEAAAKSNNIVEVERMTRESTCYDADRVRDLLMELKLQDPRPLINVCNAHNFVPELVRYFREQNQMKFIEQYALKVNVGAVPIVCGTLIDLQTNEDFIKNLILAGGNMIPAKPLMDEMQTRGKLKMIMPWLEARVNEGSTDSAVHTALAKIYIDSNQNPEQFLLTNQYYDKLDVGKHCESINPEFAATAYEKGKCHDAMVALTSSQGMFKKQAQYLVDCMDEDLWGRVLKEDTEARGHLVDQLVGQVLPECKEAHKVALCVKVFLDADLPNYLIELLDKIVLQTGQFKGEKNLETLLIMTAVKSNQERVQDYVSKLDNIDPVAVAGACTEGGLLEEAIALYEKASENEKVMEVLVKHMKDMSRATSFAAQCDDSAVWSLLARAQLDEGMVSDAIETYAKGNDIKDFNEVIAAAEREKAYEPLVSYLTMARKSAKNEMIDTELVYAYCKTGKLVDLEQFIAGPNIANVGALGERCFNEEMYEAAKIMFNNVGDFTRLVTTLCKLNDLAGAVEAARKANTIQTWRDVCKTAVDQKEFRMAKQCAQNIIVEPDELEDLISYYEQEGYVEEIMEVIADGVGLERAHM